jgi:hypothetical protein
MAQNVRISQIRGDGSGAGTVRLYALRRAGHNDIERRSARRMAARLDRLPAIQTCPTVEQGEPRGMPETSPRVGGAGGFPTAGLSW